VNRSGEVDVTHWRPEPDVGPESNRGFHLGHLLVFLTAWALTQVAFAVVQSPAVLAGAQLDSDGYFRLMRVAVLLDGGGWYDGSIPNSNWPFGQDLHWTRPLDALIVLLALPWALAVSMDTALVISGALVSPLLHAVLCLAGVWVITPLVAGPVRFLAAAALLAQPGVMAYATAGRADHHVLVLLLSVLAMGTWIRALLRPDRPLWAVWTGLAAAGAIWVSPEALVPLAAIFASGGIAWIVHGSPYEVPNLRLCLALIGGLCIAMVVERPPGEWTIPEYDRISVVHVYMGLVAIGFWFVVEVLPGRLATFRGRAFLAGSGAFLTSALLYLPYPGFFLGPGAAMDPWLREFAFGTIAELQPIIGGSWEAIGTSIAIFGLAPFALLFVGHSAVRGRDVATRIGWYPLLAGLLLFVPMAAAQTRFAGYAGAVIALGATGLLGVLLERVDGKGYRGLKLRSYRLGTMVAVMVGPFLTGGAVWALMVADEPVGSLGSEESCDLRHAINILEETRPTHIGAQVVAVHPNLGPALAYRTGDRIIAGLYHRSPEGLRDLLGFFRTSDMVEAAELARLRELDVVLICPPLDRNNLGTGSSGSLYARLADGGPVPSWLRAFNLDDESRGGFLAYRVLLTEGEGR